MVDRHFCRGRSAVRNNRGGMPLVVAPPHRSGEQCYRDGEPGLGVAIHCSAATSLGVWLRTTDARASCSPTSHSWPRLPLWRRIRASEMTACSWSSLRVTPTSGASGYRRQGKHHRSRQAARRSQLRLHQRDAFTPLQVDGEVIDLPTGTTVRMGHRPPCSEDPPVSRPSYRRTRPS